MHVMCAWCKTMTDEAVDAGVSASTSVSHSICPACATTMLSEGQQACVDAALAEILRMQALLLEMVGDLYEVAQALAPLVPTPSVRAWQATRP